MKRTAVAVLLAALLASTAWGQAQKDASPKPKNPPPKSRSFTDRVLDFLGISYTPGSVKAPEPDITGQIWVADLTSGSVRALTTDANYRSPVVSGGGKEVLALRGNDVVRIPSSGGEGIKVNSGQGILKLVRAGSQDPGKVLVLLRKDGGSHPRVGLLSLDTGAVAEVRYDPQSSQDLQMVEDLEGWSPSYGETRVFVKRQTKEGIAGTVEWSDVFVLAHGQGPVDVSRCDGVNCGQPSLSPDGARLVFVKEKQN